MSRSCQNSSQNFSIESGPRTLDSLPALPAKWTVIVFEARPSVLSVTLIKVDREIHDRREFESNRTLEVAEYIKSHPFLTSKWSFCHGMRNGGMLQEQRSVDHLWGGSSAKCELLVPGDMDENDPGNMCRFCAPGDKYHEDMAPLGPEDFDHTVKKEEPESPKDDAKFSQRLLTGEKIQQKFQEGIEVWRDVSYEHGSGLGHPEPPLLVERPPMNRWGSDKPPLTHAALIALVLQYLPNSCGSVKDMYRESL